MKLSLFIAYSLLFLSIGMSSTFAQNKSVFDKEPVLILSGTPGNRPGDFGTTGHGDAIGPTDFALDPYDNIWIMDVMNRRVQKFDKNGKFILEYPNKKQLTPIELITDYIECAPSGEIVIGPMLEGEMVVINNNGEYLRTITLPGVKHAQFDFAVNCQSKIIYRHNKETIIMGLNGNMLQKIDNGPFVSGESSSPYSNRVVFYSGIETQTITNCRLDKTEEDSKTIKNEQLDTGVEEYIGKHILIVDPFDNLFVDTDIKIEPSNRALISYNDSNGHLIKKLKKTEGQDSRVGFGYKLYDIDNEGNLYAMEVITPEKATPGKTMDTGLSLLTGDSPYLFLWKWER